jgi:peptidyl-prolyl cis-trans isomerase C
MARPILHFFLLGTALLAFQRFLLPALLPAGEASSPALVIPAERVAELRRQTTAVEPAAAAEELAARIGAEVDDELLYRRALALGLDRGDPVVRNRLIQNMRFAAAEPERDDTALYQEALALGLDRTDLVVRRRLVQRMRMRIESRARRTEPDEAALRDWFDAHAERFVRPARARVTQIYFGRDHEAQARAAHEALTGAGPEAAHSLGDPFLHPAAQPLQSERELARRFGPDFARAVFALEPGRWSAPIASAYGFHLVWVHERTEAEPLVLDDVRSQVRYAVLAERADRALAEELAALRQGVEIRVESPPPASTSR